MRKKYEEDMELEQLLEEAFIRNAEKEEKALFEQATAHSAQITDEELDKSYQKLVARLKREGIYEEDEETTSKVIPMEKKTKRKNTGRRYRIMKAAGFAFVGILCVFAASMTSEATRRYVVDGVRYLVGDDTRILVNNDEENDSSNRDEYKARAEIEEKLGVELPRFFYRPLDFEFYDYKVNDISRTAWIEYLYGENDVVAFYIEKGDKNAASVINSMHGEDADIINSLNDNCDIKIKKVEEMGDKKSSYIAQWEKDNVMYQLSGKMEFDELKKILEKMRY